MKQPYRILVIDDSAFIRMSVTKMLKEMGFEHIDTADNGRVGLEKFRSSDPQIVILDGIMPELDGLTVLRTMKSEKPHIYVIASSSLSLRAKVVEFKESGADQYLLKPYEKEKFSEVIHKAIATLEVH
jgi:two-component system chemotaxis response regulator CheY